MKWADEFAASSACGRMPISLATPRKRAYSEPGIGPLPHRAYVLRRDRIPHMQAMILARDEKTRKKALQKLLPMQRKDFAGLFQAMDASRL